MLHELHNIKQCYYKVMVSETFDVIFEYRLQSTNSLTYLPTNLVFDLNTIKNLKSLVYPINNNKLQKTILFFYIILIKIVTHRLTALILFLFA